VRADGLEALPEALVLDAVRAVLRDYSAAASASSDSGTAAAAAPAPVTG
jgi:hypothetical protein